MPKIGRFMLPAFALMLSASLCAGAETGDGKRPWRGKTILRYALTMDVDYPTLGDEKIDVTLRATLRTLCGKRLIRSEYVPDATTHTAHGIYI